MTVASIGLLSPAHSCDRGPAERRFADHAGASRERSGYRWSRSSEGIHSGIRYMIPMIPLVAIGAGVFVGASGEAAIPALLVVALVLSYEVRPLDSSASMVLEAQWDRPNVPVRQRVTDCLHEDYDGEKIMASMGSLGHYMQEMSHDGFAIRDFLHEGNGDIWLAALDWPKPYAGWLLIEEKAEGGDMLARIARERPSFWKDSIGCVKAPALCCIAGARRFIARDDCRPPNQKFTPTVKR